MCVYINICRNKISINYTKIMKTILEKYFLLVNAIILMKTNLKKYILNTVFIK